MGRVVFIVNPVSGTSSKIDIEKIIASNLDIAMSEVGIFRTEYAGHAEIIAAQAVKDGAGIVVAVGGDGTVNEVGKALIGAEAAMGVIPMGSGNGLALHLGIPTKVEAAIKLINRNRTQLIDCGIVNNRPFFCTSGVGFDAEVSKEFACSERRGLFSYAEIALAKWRSYKPDTYTIHSVSRFGEKKLLFSGEAFLVTIANAAQWGNNAYIAPNASVTDGLLDLIIVKSLPLWKIPKLGWNLFHKTLYHNSNIESYTMHGFSISRNLSELAHIDGDPLQLGSALNFSIRPSVLKVLV